MLGNQSGSQALDKREGFFVPEIGFESAEFFFFSVSTALENSETTKQKKNNITKIKGEKKSFIFKKIRILKMKTHL